MTVQAGGRNLPGRVAASAGPSTLSAIPGSIGSALEPFDFCVLQTQESSNGILKPFALRKSALAFGSGGEGNDDSTRVNRHTHLRIADTPHLGPSYALWEAALSLAEDQHIKSRCCSHSQSPQRRAPKSGLVLATGLGWQSDQAAGENRPQVQLHGTPHRNRLRHV